MILKSEVKTVLSGNPLPPPQRVIEQMVAADARDEAIRRRAEKARLRLVAGRAGDQEPEIPEEENSAQESPQGERLQMGALRGDFREFIKTNPSQAMIEAWIRTHRAD